MTLWVVARPGAISLLRSGQWSGSIVSVSQPVRGFRLGEWPKHYIGTMSAAKKSGVEKPTR